MSPVSFTQSQREAIEFTGASLVVSAAAGSGKTAVLAERCAHLVCDAPLEDRCDANQLLVLTFTEAAAAEMRTRIVEAIAARVRARPGDDRLRDQLALMDASRITTVHAFCLWLIRRWFSDLGLDPSATVIDNDETRLLKSEVLDSLFSDLYGVTQTIGAPFGKVSGGKREEPSGDESHKKENASELASPPSDVTARPQTATLGPAFARLVDDYGLGEDRQIAHFVLRLFDFTMSLSDPIQWLREAYDAAAFPKRVVGDESRQLRTELELQAEHCDHAAKTLEADGSVPVFFAGQIRAYSEQLETWMSELGEIGAASGETPANAKDSPDLEDRLRRFENVRSKMAAYTPDRATGPRLPKDAGSTEQAAYGAARAEVRDVKELFHDRLKTRFALFSVDELLEDLERTTPYLHTIVQLVLAFRERYTARKRDLGVLDFADLERFAFELLSNEGDATSPSEVAQTLRERFRHVLVDEFQDINPIQDAIIHLASREADRDRPSNLFVVGDVKQSIYRFRLADPELLIRRLRECEGSSPGGRAICLQSNFRSRAPILDAVNAVFERLMREDFGGVAYDERARLRVGRTVESGEASLCVELHLLERAWTPAPSDDQPLERGPAALSNPARWSHIEREGFLIGSRIREWMADDTFRVDGQPLHWRDIAVLLRARRINAGRIASVLTAMGIPAHADAGGSLLGAKEIRDVLAALQLFDNAQQDIPLAAVLRSGILSAPFSVDELIEIRCHDREEPFHQVVREYRSDGENHTLRDRLERLYGRLSYYRSAVRRRPLADVLWELYEEQGILAYESGLVNGAQRRGNLLELHDLARRFGTFRRQGLHRFLGFVRQLDEEKRELPGAPAVGEADDVVRIMSMHQAKGLEFPVVFVAGLGTRFNLEDRRGRMIFERGAGIGMRAIDVERMIEYPTAIHSRVAAKIEHSTREEEMRVLYVAMTRARDKLVLMGSRNGVEALLSGTDHVADGASCPSRLTVMMAANPLEWLIPAVAGDSQSGLVKTFDVSVHTADEMAGWQLSKHDDATDRETRRAAAQLAELPSEEPLAADDHAVEAVRSRVEFLYPFLSSTSVRAVMSASEFKGTYDPLRNPDQQRDVSLAGDFLVRVPPATTAARDQAMQRGIQTHRVLQHLDFTSAVSTDGLVSELHRMVGAEVLSEPEAELVDLASIEWFLSTPLAQRIRDAGRAYRREFMYLATEPLGYVDGSIDPPPEDAVLVRGVVDGVLVQRDGVELLDFKTDAIGPNEVEERRERYRSQMELYARAMNRIWRRPVQACWLVFLNAREIVSLGDVVRNDPGVNP